MNEEEKVYVNDYSLISYFTESLYNDISLSNATCFIYKDNHEIFIVTNWHVVTGRNFETNKILHSQGAVPNKLKIHLYKYEDDKNIFQTSKVFEIMLYDEQNNPKWKEIKIEQKQVDVVIIPVSIPNEYNFLSIQDAEEPFNDDTSFQIGEDVFVLGYPFGMDGGGLPIWKRASVASEPTLDIKGLPYFYIDTASRSGMSGSPVVLYKRRPLTVLTSIDGGPYSRYYTKFIGVYSGRIGVNEKDEVQLGIVWKREVIQKLISSQ